MFFKPHSFAKAGGKSYTNSIKSRYDLITYTPSSFRNNSLTLHKNQFILHVSTWSGCTDTYTSRIPIKCRIFSSKTMLKYFFVLVVCQKLLFSNSTLSGAHSIRHSYFVLLKHENFASAYLTHLSPSKYRIEGKLAGGTEYRKSVIRTRGYRGYWGSIEETISFETMSRDSKA